MLRAHRRNHGEWTRMRTSVRPNRPEIPLKIRDLRTNQPKVTVGKPFPTSAAPKIPYQGFQAPAGPGKLHLHLSNLNPGEKEERNPAVQRSDRNSERRIPSAGKENLTELSGRKRRRRMNRRADEEPGAPSPFYTPALPSRLI